MRRLSVTRGFLRSTRLKSTDLTIEVSVLGPQEPVSVTSEQELLDKMIPGDEGWVLQENGDRGYLPAIGLGVAERAG